MELPRHFSDSNLPLVPRNPSRLNPSRSVLERGTVSLPTSPVRRNFQEPPQTAHSFLNTQEPPEWYPYPSSTETQPLSLDEGTAESEIGPTRKKRVQVRIACTHCQKACKKCSNTRPCERCVKYGLKDCVDSMRKPRKSGVKRGPYKRRTSGKYEPFYDTTLQQSYSNPYPELTFTQTIPQPRQAGYISPEEPKYTPFQIPPGPRTSAIHGAFAQALIAPPRFMNGQSTSDNAVLYPPTPIVPFPISLNGIEDPFSRAVSPIHGDLDKALEGLKPEWQMVDPFALPGQIPLPEVSPGWNGILGLQKVRKPSLRTLMSHGGSLANSRQSSPVMSDSPTLFNQPMEMDDGLDMSLAGWGQVESMGPYEPI